MHYGAPGSYRLSMCAFGTNPQRAQRRIPWVGCYRQDGGARVYDAIVRSSLSTDTVFRRAAAGLPCWARDRAGTRYELPLRKWIGGGSSTDEDRRADLRILASCRGATIDLGCGPGRFTAALAHGGEDVLGVDVSQTAVELTRARGGVAIREDLFMPLPGNGRWPRVLLADGNIGIGGDPVRLMRRVRDLLAPDGVAIVEMDGPGFGIRREVLRCETDSAAGDWFPWARVSVSAATELAATVGLRVTDVIEVGRRTIVAMAEC